MSAQVLRYAPTPRVAQPGGPKYCRHVVWGCVKCRKQSLGPGGPTRRHIFHFHHTYFRLARRRGFQAHQRLFNYTAKNKVLLDSAGLVQNYPRRPSWRRVVRRAGVGGHDRWTGATQVVFFPVEMGVKGSASATLRTRSGGKPGQRHQALCGTFT